MTVDALNSRFGSPGRIVFHGGFAGYPEVVVANKYGSAEIALLGGNVLSYRPTGHAHLLFRPAKRDYNRGDSFHGGIPVCWPQFGNRFTKELPQHGFARKLVFDVRGTEYSDEMTEVRLGIVSDDATRSLWPHDFDLELKVTVSMKLTLTLTTKNTGKDAFAFSCGFHPYFLLRERDAATVRGLEGATYFDGLAGKPDVSQVGDLKVDHAVDSIYTLPPAVKHEHAVVDPGLNRAIALVSTGNDRTVVWNPGSDVSALADLAPDDWKKFVCVEPVSDWPGGRTLKPGEKHVLTAAIQGELKQQ